MSAWSSATRISAPITASMRDQSPRRGAFLHRCYPAVRFGEARARVCRDSGVTRQRPEHTAMNPFVAPAAQPESITFTWNDLAAHRAFLVHYAQRRLHDPALAEDLVHDVFEAVMTGRASFAGRSAPRSWLV